MPRQLLSLESDPSRVDLRHLSKLLEGGIAVDASQRILGTDEQELLTKLVARNLVIIATPTQCVSADPTLKYFFATQSDAVERLDALRNSRILLLGLGGSGSVVLQHLVGLGVRTYFLLDCDCVTPENLNRQYIYSRRQVGQAKTTCARRYIQERLAIANVFTYQKRIRDLSDLIQLDLDNCDLVINCLDEPPLQIERLVYEYARLRAIPAISCGVGTTSGYWGPLVVPGLTPTFNEFDHAPLDASLTRFLDCAVPRKPIAWSLGPPNTTVSTLLATDIVAWLSSTAHIPSLGRRLYVDFTSHRVTAEGIS